MRGVDSKMQNDGIHFSSIGYRELGHRYFEALRTLYKK